MEALLSSVMKERQDTYIINQSKREKILESSWQRNFQVSMFRITAGEYHTIGNRVEDLRSQTMQINVKLLSLGTTCRAALGNSYFAIFALIVDPHLPN